MWLVVTEVRSDSYELVTERCHYNGHSIYRRRVYRTSYFSSLSHVLSLNYACIWSSGITLSPRLPLCQILFLWRLTSFAELAHGEKSRTQSINQPLSHPAYFMPREPKHGQNRWAQETHKILRISEGSSAHTNSLGWKKLAQNRSIEKIQKYRRHFVGGNWTLLVM